MAQTKVLITVEVHTDTETGIDQIGDVDYGIHTFDYETHLREYGPDDLVRTLARLIHHAYETWDRVGRETEKGDQPRSCGARTLVQADGFR
jgi:hypothetical protein